MKRLPFSLVAPCILLMVLLVSKVTTSRDNEKVSILQPEFGPSPNLTKVQVDSTAFLHCSVINLQEDNQVSWIRRRDWHIMSVGDTVYTSDDRVLVSHREDSADWVLQFKFVRERDEGIYECQVTTSNGQVKSRSVHLDVVTPEAIILSTDEYRIEKGSLISLVCILENALLPPEYVFWYQNDRMINYDTGRGVTVTTTQGKKTSSRLNIQNAQPRHTGNYTCKPSSSTPASIQLFVLDDKTGALHTDHTPGSAFIVNRALILLAAFATLASGR
jgi:hypothetical protein